MKSAYNSYYEHHDGFWKFKKKTIRRDMDQFVIFLIFIRIHFTNYLNYYLEKKISSQPTPREAVFSTISE